MIITKIKLTDGRKRVAITWEEVVEGSTNHYTLDCADEPRQGLYDALNALLPLAIRACHLDECVWESAAEQDNAFISGVSLKYPDDGAVGINITAQFKDQEADGRTAVINTPYIGPDWIDSADELLIDRLCGEAEGYIKGDRNLKQLSLLEMSAMLQPV